MFDAWIDRYKTIGKTTERVVGYRYASFGVVARLLSSDMFIANPMVSQFILALASDNSMDSVESCDREIPVDRCCKQ